MPVSEHHIPTTLRARESIVRAVAHRLSQAVCVCTAFTISKAEELPTHLHNMVIWSRHCVNHSLTLTRVARKRDGETHDRNGTGGRGRAGTGAARGAVRSPNDLLGEAGACVIGNCGRTGARDWRSNKMGGQMPRMHASQHNDEPASR